MSRSCLLLLLLLIVLYLFSSSNLFLFTIASQSITKPSLPSVSRSSLLPLLLPHPRLILKIHQPNNCGRLFIPHSTNPYINQPTTQKYSQKSSVSSLFSSFHIFFPDHWIIKHKLYFSIRCPLSHCIKFMIILPTMSKLLAPPSSHYIIDISSSSFHQASISFSLFVFHFLNLCPKCTFSVLFPYVCFSYWYIG